VLFNDATSAVAKADTGSCTLTKRNEDTAMMPQIFNVKCLNFSLLHGIKFMLETI